MVYYTQQIWMIRAWITKKKLISSCMTNWLIRRKKPTNKSLDIAIIQWNHTKHAQHALHNPDVSWTRRALTPAAMLCGARVCMCNSCVRRTNAPPLSAHVIIIIIIIITSASLLLVLGQAQQNAARSCARAGGCGCMFLPRDDVPWPHRTSVNWFLYRCPRTHIYLSVYVQK